MGGRGSGRRNYGGGDGKTTTESQHRIDIRWLKKQGYLRPGVAGLLSWSRSWDGESKETGSIGYKMEANRMILFYRIQVNGGEWVPAEQTIRFDRTPCNYGGYRQWFLCRCGRRVAVLYGAGKYFLCRHCYDLCYTSQQETEIDRMMRKTRKIRDRLGTSQNLSMPIWRRPKGMHKKTFDRLQRRDKEINVYKWGLVKELFRIEL